MINRTIGRMAQILNFRHIPFLSSKPNSHLRFLSTLIASSSRRRRNVAPLNLRRRYTAMEVEESSSLGPTTGFNKRRAEGTDKTNFTRKNLQLKVRKLNPINTISYVQVFPPLHYSFSSYAVKIGRYSLI